MKRKLTKKILAASLSLLFVVSCSKKDDFLYYQNPQTPATYSTTQAVKEMTGTDKIDMLWVIGGMTELFQNFHDGTTDFMNNFIKVKGINWRMAMVADEVNDPPFLGMGAVGPFDMTTPNPVGTFVGAVDTIVGGGYDGEQLNDPAASALSNYPEFVRSDAILAIIITNDASDESTFYRTYAAMSKFLKGVKGSLDKVVVYGVIGSEDFGCTDIDGGPYYGTELEKLINGTHGQVLSLCSNTFGKLLSKIADNLVSRVSTPRVYLEKRPVVSSLVVKYHDQVLPGGKKENGGFWFYNFDDNAVVFYSLDFATNDNDSVTVDYTEDVGQASLRALQHL